ncbi:MAG: GNAT family N-acetyltransferase [Chitinophagaceae bacterium]
MPAEATLHFSPKESARFGLRVFRADVESLDTAAFVDALDRDRIDVAIVRLRSAVIASIDALHALGLAPIVADTIVRYEIDLPSRAAAEVTPILRIATPNDAALLASLAREIFADYLTHYHANPLFRRVDILDGYAEWAASHVADNSSGNAAWIVEIDGKPAGFSCYRIDADTRLAVGVLNGVVPLMRERGIYRRMLRQMLREFGARDLRRFAIATQAQNATVRRVWSSEDLTLRCTYTTLHVNALKGTHASPTARYTAEACRPESE